MPHYFNAYYLPEINLSHLMRLKTELEIVFLSKNDQLEVSTGYTLGNNARGLVCMRMHFKMTGDKESLNFIQRYLSFIYNCRYEVESVLPEIAKHNQQEG